MGNLGCCGSKKGKSFDADSLNEGYDYDLSSGAGMNQGILGPGQALFDDDEFFDKYIDENLEDPNNNKDEVGHLTFDYFIKVYKTALIWNRVKFANRKAELVEQRRKALKNDDMAGFRQAHFDIGTADEQCLQDVLEEILVRINLDDKHFQESLNFHFDDPEKKDTIREAMEDAKVDRGEGKPKSEFKEKEVTMSKDEVMAAQKKMQEISIEEIKYLKTIPPADIQSEIKYLQPKM